MTDAPLALPEPVEQSPQAPTIYKIVVIALAALGVLTVVGGVALAWALLLRLWVTLVELAFVGSALLADGIRRLRRDSP